MKDAKHLLMCAPMILVVGILLATGSGIGILLPLAACMLMMGVMMAMMMGGMRQGGGGGGRPDEH
jgi:hypothetical protein